jgi:hypothetical protein
LRKAAADPGDKNVSNKILLFFIFYYLFLFNFFGNSFDGRT